MNNKPKWQKKEYKDVDDFNGKETIASGRTWSDKGDVKTRDWMIDSKYTEKKSYSVSLKTWDKLYEQALMSFRLPMLSLQIQDLELVVVNKEDFVELLNAKKENEENKKKEEKST